jgi:hypothetical protein
MIPHVPAGPCSRCRQWWREASGLHADVVVDGAADGHGAVELELRALPSSTTMTFMR